MNDHDYMRLALQLAENGCGWTSPNPMVGAVIVKNGAIIGQGWHEKYGGPHAERNALASCQTSADGATMYVTLEPCCHYGKQPPCTHAILEAGIKRVVIGSDDPNPLVSGKGIQFLRTHGIEVTEHILKEDCDRLNEVFFHYIQTKHPFVVMKYAMTMDGKIAAYTGASKWITGEISRNHVQKQRHRYSAIMVGVGTVLADDPLLTCRIDNGKNPVRIICDTHLRTPISSQIVRTAKQVPTILATCCSDKDKQLAYENYGCHILCLNEKKGHVDLQQLMQILGQKQIDSILLEGGAALNWSALENGIVQKVQAYIAPKLFGGRTARTPIAGQGVSSPFEAFHLRNSTITCLGEDFLIESEVIRDVYRDCGRNRNDTADPKGTTFCCADN
ncbi:MAG: bifunctional diaminohydroxyphosphoribosylaminopyrimidine deaminase/5-amino-6-(5-phosphoribosylamino)uracil reductase RibD [Brotaphodocola sp.]